MTISVRVGADTTFYGYNAAGRLVTRARNHNSGTTKRTLERVFFWDADHLLVETDSTLVTPVAEYAYAPGVDRPLALLTPGAGGTTKIRYYHQDEVGNVIGLTDSTAVVQALEYRPWGDLAPSTLGTVGDTSRVRWKGLLWEEGKTQLYYVRNRWYDAVARRFLTEDPIGIEGGLNLYAFAGNDPVNYGDPSGLERCKSTEQWAMRLAEDGAIEFYCVQALGGVTVTAAPWQSETSTNFLNSNARGGLPVDLPLEPQGDRLERALVIAAAATSVAVVARGVALSIEQAGTLGIKNGRAWVRSAFGKGGLLNSNRYLRVGFSRDGGDHVFRASGRVIGWFKDDPHIVIRNFGPLR